MPSGSTEVCPRQSCLHGSANGETVQPALWLCRDRDVLRWQQTRPLRRGRGGFEDDASARLPPRLGSSEHRVVDQPVEGVGERELVVDEVLWHVPAGAVDRPARIGRRRPSDGSGERQVDAIRSVIADCSGGGFRLPIGADQLGIVADLPRHVGFHAVARSVSAVGGRDSGRRRGLGSKPAITKRASAEASMCIFICAVQSARAHVLRGVELNGANASRHLAGRTDVSGDGLPRSDRP